MTILEQLRGIPVREDGSFPYNDEPPLTAQDLFDILHWMADDGHDLSKLPVTTNPGIVVSLALVEHSGAKEFYIGRMP